MTHDTHKTTNPQDTKLLNVDPSQCKVCGSTDVTPTSSPWCYDCWKDGKDWERERWEDDEREERGR